MPQHSASPDETVAHLKVPPHSIEAEASVIGGLMLNSDAWLEVADELSPSDFYRSEHKIIYETMQSLWDANEPVDVLTVADALQRSPYRDRIVAADLAELVEATPSTANLPHYARIVRRRSLLRQLIRTASRIQGEAFDPESTGDEAVAALLEEAEQSIYRIAGRHMRGTGPRQINPITNEAMAEIRRIHEAEGSLSGTASGFIDLDKMTSGLKPTDLIIVAGRPSMGKTAFALNIAEYIALEQKLPVVVFSLEMAAEQLLMRMISGLSSVSQSDLHSGDVTDRGWMMIGEASRKLRDAPMWIDDTAALSPTDLRARVRRVELEAKSRLGLIVVDYIQLMRLSRPAENRNVEISQISQQLKALAKEMHCPVIALSQLNRDVEKRQNKRPILADLRDSGALEQDADLIVFIYRDEFYNEDSPDKGKAEANLAKQRNGATGTVHLQFQGEYARFNDLAQSRYDDYEVYGGPRERDDI